MERPTVGVKGKGKCDACQKRTHYKQRMKKVKGMEFYYLHCNKCDTVFPSYVVNDDMKKNFEKMEQLRQRFEKLEEDSEVLANVGLDILNLKKTNVAISNRLTVQHYHEFRNWGRRVWFPQHTLESKGR